MSAFITRRLLNLFDALSLSKDFLAVPVGTWSEREDYRAARNIVHALKVVNDCVERAVKLATDFNEVLTTDDCQRQLLYQVAEYHRNLPTCSATKSQLLNSN